MTRRDRIALALAYECLRRQRQGKRSLRGHAATTVDHAHHVLSEGHDGSWEGSVALDITETIDAARGELDAPHSPRLLRARLALAIRALLRADRSDFGPQRLMDPKHSDVLMRAIERGVYRGNVGAFLDVATQLSSRRITPLWEQANRGRR